MQNHRCSLIVVALLAALPYLVSFSHFNPHRRPRLMGDILPYRAISPDRQRVKDKIVMYHNFFRTKVHPKAGNMLKMKWHNESAKAAQKWAEKCKFLIHDTFQGRHVDGYGSCGQNIFIASTKVPWLFAVETWWLEKNYFKYGEKNNLTMVGHYTQLVWAASHEIGCGLSKCHQDTLDKNGTVIPERKRAYFNYVCNYCPIGNRPGRTSFPYKLGNPCSLCKRNCTKKLCLNSCDVADLWANCKELYKIHPSWLCRTNTPKGKQRSESCKATCTCSNKVYD